MDFATSPLTPEEIRSRYTRDELLTRHAVLLTELETALAERARVHAHVREMIRPLAKLIGMPLPLPSKKKRRVECPYLDAQQAADFLGWELQLDLCSFWAAWL